MLCYLIQSLQLPQDGGLVNYILEIRKYTQVRWLAKDDTAIKFRTTILTQVFCFCDVSGCTQVKLALNWP